MKIEFSQQIFQKKKKKKKKKNMKSCQVGAESFQADRHDAGNSRFSQLYKCT